MNKTTKKILVLQHIDVEHPGVFCDYMREDGILWDTVELDQGETIPALENYAGLIVMGGPMDVWQEKEFPWLVTEKVAIKRAVIDLNLPYLGICLGHQLLATALNGEVGPMMMPEVGILGVELSNDGLQSPIFSGINQQIKCLQWHGAEVIKAPSNSKVIAYSPACAIQALQVGEKAFSMQYHVELTTTTISDWGKISEYEKSLEKSFGEGALPKLEAQANQHMKEFNQTAYILYNNFKNILTGN